LFSFLLNEVQKSLRGTVSWVQFQTLTQEVVSSLPLALNVVAKCDVEGLVKLFHAALLEHEGPHQDDVRILCHQLVHCPNVLVDLSFDVVSILLSQLLLLFL
jgi:hypothetical protein